MRTFYFPGGIRFHWQKPTQYRPRIGHEFNPRSEILYLGWLVIEREWLECSMTGTGAANRIQSQGVVV